MTERKKRHEHAWEEKRKLARDCTEYFVDVQDTALLHIAVIIHPGIVSERIFAFAEPVNGDSILAVMRKLYPDRRFPSDFQAEQDLSNLVPRKRAEELLCDMGKQR